MPDQEFFQSVMRGIKSILRHNRLEDALPHCFGLDQNNIHAGLECLITTLLLRQQEIENEPSGLIPSRRMPVGYPLSPEARQRHTDEDNALLVLGLRS